MPSSPQARLKHAAKPGWADDAIFDDADFDSLRGDPQFEAIVAEIKKRIGEEQSATLAPWRTEARKKALFCRAAKSIAISIFQIE